MSKAGRRIIDKIKACIGNYVKLPVPPYGSAGYWEGVYASLGPSDTFEWGRLAYDDLKSHHYREIEWKNDVRQPPLPLGPLHATTLRETLKVHPHADRDEPILLVGCGNSTLGYDMHQDGYRGPMLHVDISSRVVQTMALKWQEWQRTGDLTFLEDDATVLSSIPNQHVAAAVDKGLVDALFCADQSDACAKVLHAVHRVLQPGGVLAVLSFSRPEYLIPALSVELGFNIPSSRGTPSWESIQVRELDRIFLYRFQKTAQQQASLSLKSSKRARRR